MKMVEVAVPRSNDKQSLVISANETRSRFLNDFDTFFSVLGDAQGASSISPFTSTLRISPGFEPSGIVISSSTVFEAGDIAFSSLVVSRGGMWKLGNLFHTPVIGTLTCAPSLV